MLSVKIEDFQSIEKASFEVDGFTVIIGDNNIGKSAVIRAIDAALNNRTGMEFIRLGKKKTKVSLQKDGLDIEWSKGDTATYKVNGQPFSKLNKAVPQPILDAGIKKIEVGDLKLNPLIANQFDEIFLLDKPGSVITDVLSVMYKLNVLSDADDLCLKELRSKKSLLKLRENDHTQLKEQLEKFDGLDTIKETLKEIKALKSKCEEIRREVTLLSGYLTQIADLKRSIEDLKKVATVVIPETGAVEELEKEYDWLATTMTSFKQSLSLVKNLDVASRVEVPDYKSLETLLQEFNTVSELGDQLKKSATAIRSLGSTRDILNSFDFLGKLETVVTLSGSLESLQDTEHSYSTSSDTVADLQKTLEKTDQDLKTAQDEFSKFDVCPACKRPM